MSSAIPWNYITMNKLTQTCLLLVAMTTVAGTTANQTGQQIRCPDVCRCDHVLKPHLGGKVIMTDCNGHRLHDMPQGISNFTELLTMDDNSMYSLAPVFALKLISLRSLSIAGNRLNRLIKFPYYKSLAYLNLDNNVIDYIPENIFQDIQSLRQLSLSENVIDQLNSNAFVGLDNLKVLKLSNNRLETLADHWFKDLGRLEVLDVSNNPIATIRNRVFTHLEMLKILDLSNCDVKVIERHAFDGLSNLTSLLLNNNRLRDIPTLAFQMLLKINIIDLSGNRVDTLNAKVFHKINVTRLKLASMPDLILVERDAFEDLPHLEELELHDNKKLVYVDPNAINNTRALRKLDLHNNKLTAVPLSLLQNKASNFSLSIHGNNLLCDCNLNWIFKQPRGVLIRDIGTTSCFDQNEIARNVLLQGRNYTSKCTPVIIRLFKRQYTEMITNSFIVKCRAVGVPIPKIQWKLPDGNIYNTGHNDSKLTIDGSGTLHMRRLGLHDEGHYVCIASNAHGRSEMSTNLTIERYKAKVLLMNVGADFIRFTWSGTETGYDYEILLRNITTKLDMKEAGVTFHAMALQSYMRDHTFTGLAPLTSYNVCITLAQKHFIELMHCLTVKTKKENKMIANIFNLREYIVGASVGIAVIFTTCATICAIVVKKYNRSHGEPGMYCSGSTSRLCASSNADSNSEIFPITYENAACDTSIFNEDDINDITQAANAASTSSPSTHAHVHARASSPDVDFDDTFVNFK